MAKSDPSPTNASRAEKPPNMKAVVLLVGDTEQEETAFEPVSHHANPARAHTIKVRGRVYTHVGEDAHGRWTYRA